VRDAVAGVVDELNQRAGHEVAWCCNELWDEGFVVGVRREHAGALREQAQRAGAHKAIELEVEGAFHTPLMSDAQRTFATALADLRLREANGDPALRATVYSNVTGAPYESLAQVLEVLPAQLCRPVRWAQILGHVKRRSERIARVILPPPGDQLAGMLKVQSPALYSKHVLI
jgi:[acyl-carrier-protein] S-malonyltransferase